jgi:hypothetical protein
MWLLRTIKSASSIRGCEPRLGGESRAMAKHGGRTSMQYFPLKVERNEIRLLKILPQEKLDEPATQIRSQEIIQCTLEHVSLDEFTEDSKDYFSQSGKDVYTAEAFWDRMREKYRAAGLLPPRHSEEEDDAIFVPKSAKE